MDLENLVPIDGLESAHQNGVHDQGLAPGNDVVSNNANGTFEKTAESAGPYGNSENVSKLEDDSVNNSSTDEFRERPHINAESNGFTSAKEGEVKAADPSEQVKSLKGSGKSTKSSNPKNAPATQVKTGEDGKVAGDPHADLNGLVTSDSKSKQPLKSKSFNEKQVQASKHSGKSDVTSSEGLTEWTKLKALKKGPVPKAEGDTETSSPTTEDAKPRRFGTLPNYGFSFKCDERAEKRKEFYSKLEEKIHAKEVEKNTLQAKSKESQEAEIKLLRKSLTFRATPMPSFYQEPPPPKAELKKIPTTRPKSPKLGRRKSSSSVDSEGKSGQSSQPGRLSLDENVSQNNSAKAPSPIYLKKPQRKSLPKLPSQKTSLSSATNNEKSASSKATNQENATTSNQMSEDASPTQEQDAVPGAVAKEIQCVTNEELIVEEQAQPTLVQELIASEH